MVPILSTSLVERLILMVEHFITALVDIPEELLLVTGFCGHPSLIRADYVRSIARHIDTNINPEKQFHSGNDTVTGIVDTYRYGVVGIPGTDPLIMDIGRRWLAETEWEKKGNKAWFVEWEQVPA